MPDAGIDVATIAIWLGHAEVESPQPYVHANMTMKENPEEDHTHERRPRKLQGHGRNHQIPQRPLVRPTATRQDLLTCADARIVGITGVRQKALCRIGITHSMSSNSDRPVDEVRRRVQQGTVGHRSQGRPLYGFRRSAEPCTPIMPKREGLDTRICQLPSVNTTCPLPKPTAHGKSAVNTGRRATRAGHGFGAETPLEP